MIFRELSDHDVHALATGAPDRLLRYVARARAAGRGDLAARALQILVWAWEPVAVAMARAKVPDGHAEDVAHEALVRAARSIESAAPQAASVVQLRAWLRVVVARAIADFHAARRPDTVSLDGVDGWPAGVPAVDGGYGAVELGEQIERLLVGLSPRDRLIIERKLLEGATAAETAAAVELRLGERVSENAVDQIASRFRRALREQAGQV